MAGKRSAKQTSEAVASKDIIGGMDTGGGVGFGIPSDYGISDQPTDVTVINQNGQVDLAEGKSLAGKETLGNLPEQTEPITETDYSYNVVPVQNEDGTTTLILEASGASLIKIDAPGIPVQQVMSKMLGGKFQEFQADVWNLPVGDSIRVRSQQAIDDYLIKANIHVEKLRRLNNQKTAALEMIEPVRTLQETLVKAFQTEDAQKSAYNESVGNLNAAITAAASKNGLMLDDVSPEVVAAITNIGDEGGVVNLDESIAALDAALTSLPQVGEHGAGSILADEQEARRAVEQGSSEAERLSQDVKMLIRKRGINFMSNPVKTAAKQTYRLLEEVNQENEPIKVGDGLVPDNVPNYRLAIDSSPRVCGNCRFRQDTSDPNMIQCKAYDFMAKPNYVCDAWQAQNLTSVHTMVRSLGAKDAADFEPDLPGGTLSPMIIMDGHPREQQGVVQGQRLEDQQGYTYTAEVSVPFSVPQPPAVNVALANNDPTRAASKNFLPGDTVYSSVLQTLAVVKDIITLDGLKLYGLKLIDAAGVAHGSSFSYGTDLTPRSGAATKNKQPARSQSRVKSADPDLDEIVQVTRSVYQALKDICEAHADPITVPLSNKEVLTPLREDMLKTLESPVFEGVTTGPKRKYWRAIQAALVSVGAGRQVLFEGYKTINAINREDDPSTKAKIRSVMVRAQTDAMERMKAALKFVEDSLTLPSATHDMEAPGLE